MSNSIITESLKTAITVGCKVVGHTDGNRFLKSVVGSKHRLRSPPAWCISAEVFDKLVIDGIHEIIISDKESGLTYRTTMDNFARHCFPIQRGSFEKQLALPLNKWKLEGSGHSQLSLWGGDNSG